MIEQIIILVQIIFIDIILAADNAIIIGLIAASFVPKNRKQIILWGVAGALIFKIFFAIFATYLFEFYWIKVLCGILLIWIVNDLRKDLFENIKINGLPVYVVNQFMPLFSITSGIKNVELSINTRVLELRYDFLIPNENLDDYVKVVVKFMQRDEIEKLLER